jgi:hypothetical protein
MLLQALFEMSTERVRALAFYSVICAAAGNGYKTVNRMGYDGNCEDERSNAEFSYHCSSRCISQSGF